MKPITLEQKNRAVEYLKVGWHDKVVSKSLHIDLQHVVLIRKELGLLSAYERKQASGKAFKKIRQIRYSDNIFNGALRHV